MACGFVEVKHSSKSPYVLYLLLNFSIQELRIMYIAPENLTIQPI